jgi:hypothetical protein
MPPDPKSQVWGGWWEGAKWTGGWLDSLVEFFHFSRLVKILRAFAQGKMKN